MTVHRQVPSLVWLVLLFIGSRLVYLTLIHPDRFFILPEPELYHGTIAQELVHGLHRPFIDYRGNNYSGGSLVVGAIASGFFRLLGPTVFALKLAPLVFFTGALVFWVLTLRHHLSERVAVYFALLFIFSPPLFTSYSLTAFGGNPESICFTAATLFLLWGLLSDPQCPRPYPILMGITAGFGLWFNYIYGITLLALLLFWLWHEDRSRLKTRLAFFAPSFLVGVSPWIIMNFLDGWAGLVIRGAKVWDHFAPALAFTKLSDFRSWFPYQLYAAFASNDPSDLSRRVLNLPYAVLFLVPILAAGVVVLKAPRTKPTGPKSDHVNLTHFSLLYLGLFALAVQFSDFKEPRYNMAVYPFLFLLLATSVARLEDAFPSAQRRIQMVFLSGVILLAIAGHSVLFSLEQAGSAFSAKGYSYGTLPEYYFCHDELDGCDERIIQQLEQTAFVSLILPKLAPEDQRELSLALLPTLAGLAESLQQAGEFSRLERLIPPGFEKQFYYLVGVEAISQHPNDLPKDLRVIDFLRDRSDAAYHLALAGIFRAWPQDAVLDAPPDALARSLDGVDLWLAPHRWRAVGQYAGRYWYHTDRSLEHLHSRLDSWLPRLDPSVQGYVLQGVGEFLFRQWTGQPFATPPFAPTWMERLPPVYRQGLFEGAGMALGELEWLSWLPRYSHSGLYWDSYTSGLSDTSLLSIREGMKQFSAIFEEPMPTVSAEQPAGASLVKSASEAPAAK